MATRHLTALLIVPFIAAAPSRQTTAATASQVPDYSQEAYIVEQSRAMYRFENDGTGRREIYMRLRTQSDAGVQAWGQLALGYNAATERMHIMFVRVHKADGTVVTASTDAVQDLSSPVQREAPVYTDFRQKHVTVPGLRPGETLEFDVVTEIHTPIAAGHFWMEYDFNKENIILDEQLELDVPKGRPVRLKMRPGVVPVTTEAAGRLVFRWTSSHRTLDKKDDSLRSNARFAQPEPPAVRLTTFQSWEEVGQWYAMLERAPRAASPEIRRMAQELTSGRTRAMEKLEALYDFVAKDFRYVSVSLGAGRYQPRPAADVLREQYGDCKDKHTLLASLSETIGLHASTVLVNSRLILDPEFPSPSQFDHVITRAVADAQDVWLDVTTEVAPFRLLSPNLRNKQALVIPPDGPAHLEKTPANPPMINSEIQEVDGKLADTGKLSAHIRVAMRGDVELIMRSIFHRTPAARWKDVVEQMNAAAGLGGEVTDVKVSDPRATRQPFGIEYGVSMANYVDWAKKSVAMTLPWPEMAVSDPRKAEDVAAIELGAPVDSEYRMRLELEHGHVTRIPVPVSIQRDYGDYRAAYKLDGQILSAERVLHVRLTSLPADRASDYDAFRRIVAADADQRVALEIAAAGILQPSAGLKADELMLSGSEALRSGNYAQAAMFLKGVVELEPAHKTAWNNLGVAYLNLRQIDAAIEAFRKQIEINPYDEYSYNNLGRAHRLQQHYSDAEAAFRKVLEVNPLDKWVHGNLGSLYIEASKYEEAIPELEKAISTASHDASLHVHLGTAYLNLEKNQEALSAFGRAAALAANPTTWNNIAYQLALKGVYLDRAQQYAEAAVASVTAASRTFTVDHFASREIAVVGSMANYWDTLGWVFFAKGELARAEKLVSAAWALAQHSEVGDHLGQIYERQQRRDEAVRAYALALSAERPTRQIHEHLATLVGDRANVDEVTRKHAGELSHLRTFPVDVAGPGAGSADFVILIGAHSMAESVLFVSGDQKLRPLGDALRRTAYGGVFPDDTPAKIIRRGTLTCSAAGERGQSRCTFTFIPTGESQPVQ